MKNVILAITLLTLCHSLSAQREANISIQTALEQISGDSIRSHIAYLADDALRGRLPGTPEYRVAMDYVIRKFKSYGLEPAGENGTFLQEVTVRTAKLKTDGAEMHIEGPDGHFSPQLVEDYMLFPDLNHAAVTVEAPVVFAGYGLQVPQAGLTDYEGLDVKGKIVIALRGVPDGLPSEEAAHLGYSKDQIAKEHGAVGLLEVYPAQYRGFQRRAAIYQLRGKSGVVPASGRAVSLRNGVSDPNFVQGMLSRKALNSLLNTMGVDTIAWKTAVATQDYRQIQFNGKIRLRVEAEYEEWSSYNVLAKIPGSDPKLKSEHIVHSAHLDHVGVGRAVEGDSIYNGAHDNASGVAVALEIARAYSRLSEKPRRSILFNMVTAEEKGLLGSLYFANQPTTTEVVANINTDMPTIITPMHSIIALGAPYSSLGKQVRKAARYLDLEVIDDPEPEQVRFVRSDQYSFVRAGIPALHIKHSRQAAPGMPAVAERYRYFEQNIYHKPADELRDEWFDFSAGRQYAQVNFLVSYLAAQNRKKPRWKRKSLFQQ